MPVGKKLAVVLSVVVAGTGVAFFFRKDASQFRFWQSSTDDPFGQRIERRVTTQPAWVERGSSAGTATQTPRAQRVPTAATAAIPEPNALASQGLPTFQKNLNPVGALLPPIEGIVTDNDDFEDSGASNATGGRPFPAANDALRHTVVDGDTLSKLAARYLGRADAYKAIFEFNRDVLATPELLPIGAVLKIPPRPGADAVRAVGFEGESAPQMVPVPSGPPGVP